MRAPRLATTQYVADKIDATTPPEGVTLATRNEHLANNPPDDEAAVPAYVGDMIEVAVGLRFIDNSPGRLTNELANR